jgi:purine-binding chemotaxis protein CheW
MTDIGQNKINQYLTFKIADAHYAINVGNIREVLSVTHLTKIPHMPDFMSGIINLRGTGVPVLDLSKKFGMGETVQTVNTGIIVTEIAGVGADEVEEKLTIGIFSDLIQKVITIEPSEIEPPPKIGIRIDTAFIVGMGHIENDFIIILNIEKILSGTELQEIQEQELVV